MKLRKEVEWFAKEMEKVLKENDFKGGWGEDFCEEYYLFDELKGEVKELLGEVKLFRTKGTRDKKQIIKECVDIANYAMMIADRNR